MLEVDIEQFWADDEIAHKANCFSPEAPQVALAIRMSDECVFAELDEPGEPWGNTPIQRRLQLNNRYNDKAEKIVGRRLLSETAQEYTHPFPPIKPIGEVFGGEYVFENGSTWLKQSCRTPKELESVLDEVEKTDLRERILPPDWEAQKQRVYQDSGKKPSPFRGVRGPVTLATSIYGPENLVFLILDVPELAMRFSQAISDVIVGYTEIMDIEAGYSKDCAPPGFSFCDDNCCLLNDQMYEMFAYPILKRIFDRWSPVQTTSDVKAARNGQSRGSTPQQYTADVRYQHSDSAMAHLLPVLARLNLTCCNFGPTVSVDQIRKHMPRTRIDGCLAPFTFMSNDQERIIAEVKRDCQMAKEARGLNVMTAGSINNGSRLESMRAVMHAIQKHGRY